LRGKWRLTVPVPTPRIDSPNALMMNSWQRSARCPPVIVQSVVRERPSPGVKNPHHPPVRSMATAPSQSAVRAPSWASPPATHSTPEATSQASTR
jgi:hypothetical protein